MCLTVTQAFLNCNCTITRNLICADHVEHTRKQIDNLPCPQAKNRFIEMKHGGCSPYDKCKEREREVWVFNHFTADQGDFTFLEWPGIDFGSKYPKCLEQGGFTKHHDCGIGKTVNVSWRHLKKNGEPIKEEAEDEKKIKREPTEEDMDVEMENLRLVEK